MYPSEVCITALDAAACRAGSHAFAGLAALLASALLAAGLFAWAARGAAPAPGGAPHPDRGARNERALAAAIGVALLAFAAIAYGVTHGGAFVAADRAFSEAAHESLSAPMLRAFEWISWLGNGSFLALLCAAVVIALLARGERLLAIGIVAALGGNGLVDAVLKRVFTRVRPPDVGVVLEQFHGWSFPSGHAAGAMVGYGFLAYVALRLAPPRWRGPCLALAAALVALVGASRVFINAHFASDVLAGFASGTAWLLACVLVVERVRRRASTGGARPQPSPPALVDL